MNACTVPTYWSIRHKPDGNTFRDSSFESRIQKHVNLSVVGEWAIFVLIDKMTIPCPLHRHTSLTHDGFHGKIVCAAPGFDLADVIGQEPVTDPLPSLCPVALSPNLLLSDHNSNLSNAVILINMSGDVADVIVHPMVGYGDFLIEDGPEMIFLLVEGPDILFAGGFGVGPVALF